MADDVPESIPDAFTVRVFQVRTIQLGLSYYTDSDGKDGPLFVEMKVTPEGLETDTLPVGIVLPEGIPMTFHLPAEALPELRKSFEDMDFLR